MSLLYILVPTTKERREKFSVFLNALRTNDYPYVLCTYEGEHEGCVKAVHKMLEGINGLILFLSDDMILSSTYLKVICDSFYKAFPNEDGIAQGYEPSKRGRYITNPLCHSSLFKKYFHEGYYHNCADLEFTERVKQDNVPWIYVKDAKQEHRHFTLGYQYDETYNNSRKRLDDDKALFEKRCGKRLPSSWGKRWDQTRNKVCVLEEVEENVVIERWI